MNEDQIFCSQLYLIDLTRIKEFLLLEGIYGDPNRVQIEMLEEFCRVQLDIGSRKELSCANFRYSEYLSSFLLYNDAKRRFVDLFSTKRQSRGVFYLFIAQADIYHQYLCH